MATGSKHQFERIVCTDVLNLDHHTKAILSTFSLQPLEYLSEPLASPAAVAVRIGDADAVLMSFATPMGQEVLEQCPNVKYIGICGTNLQTVDLKHCEKHGIVVRNVTDYSDEATAEWVLGQYLRLCRGWGEDQLFDQPCELTGKLLGIIGMGAVGQKLVDRALGFEMQVIYYSRSRKPEIEAKGVTFKCLEELLGTADVISLHVPKNLLILDAARLAQIRAGAVVINTSLGQTMEMEALVQFAKKGRHYLVMDRGPDKVYWDQLAGMERTILVDETAGITLEARARLGNKVIEQMAVFLASQN